MHYSIDSSIVLVAGAVALCAGCRGTGRLAEYDFRDRSVAVAYALAPHPEVLTGPWFPNVTDNPVRAILEVGGRIAKEVEASRVRSRLDSAVAGVDVVDRMATRTLDRSARLLRARPVADEAGADYVVEVVMRRYGIDAKDWNAAAHFFVDADVFLIGGQDGVQIWRSHVRERDGIMPAIYGPGTVIRDVVTAATLAALSVEEIEHTLERLADFAADRITSRLRDAMEKVQRADQGF